MYTRVIIEAGEVYLRLSLEQGQQLAAILGALGYKAHDLSEVYDQLLNLSLHGSGYSVTVQGRIYKRKGKETEVVEGAVREPLIKVSRVTRKHNQEEK